MANDIDHRHDLILNAFSPRIAVFTSQEADEACRRNRLPNFACLLRPFQNIPKVTVRHSNYASVIRPSFLLSFVPAERLRAEFNESAREDDSVWLDRSTNEILKPARLEDWLDEFSHASLPAIAEDEQDDHPRSASLGPMISTPWYHAFLKAVLDRRLPNPFDTCNHPMAALLVVSTNDPEPLNEFATLYEASNKGGSAWPAVPWLDTNPVLRYYVLLHETSDEPDGGRGAATELLGAVSRAYGLHCALVCVNSEKSEYLRHQRHLNTDPHFKYDESGPAHQSTPDPWAEYQSEFECEVEPGSRYGEWMAPEDILGLKVFLREFVIQSLVPHMERCVQNWNETLTASRKGITGRLFSAGRKYFAKSSDTGSPNTLAYNPITRCYPHQSAEFQTRRLADYAFMLGDYKLASQTYEYVRKDTLGDKAWIYYISATHMSGLCALLQITPGQLHLHFNPHDFLFDPAALSQMGVFDSLRVAFVYNETAKSIGHSRTMSSSLLRTAALLDDVAAAVLYEETATILPARRAMLYLVLASRRYELSGQRLLSTQSLRRCEGGAGWTGIADYVDEVLGRQAGNEGNWLTAAEHCWQLIQRRLSNNGDGNADVGHLEDLRAAFEALDPSDREALDSHNFAGGLVDVKSTKVRIPQRQRDREELHAHTQSWEQLTKEIPPDCVLLKDSDKNMAIVNLPFYLDLALKNPLSVALKMTDIHIRVTTIEESGNASESVEDFQGVELASVPDLELLPDEYRTVTIQIICAQEDAKFEFSEIKYKFDGMIGLSQKLGKKGRRLQTTLAERLGHVYARDESMDVHVQSDGPRIEVSGTHLIPTELFAGETVASEFKLKNVGSIGLQQLACVISHSSFLRIASEAVTSIYLADSSTESKSVHNTHRDSVQMPNHLINNSPVRICDELGPSQAIDVPMICRGEMCSGEYVSFRHVHVLDVVPSLQLKPLIRPNIAQKGFYTLTVEIENEGVPEDVEIYQITTIGTHWTSDVLLQSTKPLKISSEGRAITAFKLVPWAGAGPDHATTFMLRQLQRLLAKEALERTTPPDPVVACISTSYSPSMVHVEQPALMSTILSTHRALRQTALGQAFTAIPTHLLAHIFPLTVPRSVDLLVFWRTSGPGPVRSGHHHVADLRLGVTSDVVSRILATIDGKAGGMYAESQREQRKLVEEWRRSEFGVSQDPLMVEVALEGGDHAEWDFRKLGPMTLGVRFELKNLSIETRLRYRLILQKREPRPEGRATQWVGDLVFCGEIGPLGSRLVGATCWVVEEGALDVGRWVCESRLTGEEADGWSQWGLQRLVSVRDSRSRLAVMDDLV